MEIKKTDLLIIGSGVTGLTMGYYLNKHGKDFLIIDKLDRAGGVVHTDSKDGFLYENGPNTALISNVSVVQLLDDLKEQCNLKIGSKLVNKRYILKKGKWEAMPMGPLSAIKTPLFSLKDKFKVLGEPFRAKGTNPDESLAGLVKRRLGKSFLEYAIDPFILGVYAGDPDLLITKYALPKLYNLEQKYGSFIGGSIKKGKEPKTELEKKANKAMYSFEGGFQAFVNALSESAGKEHFILGAEQLKVEKIETGYLVSYINKEGQESQIESKRLISTSGAHALEGAFSFIPKERMDKLSNLKYAKVVEIALGFKKWNGMPLDGFGGLIPHKEDRKLLGVMFMSALFEGRAPKEGALFSIFMGGIRRPEIINMSDDEIKKILEEEFVSIMGVDDFNPELLEIHRHAYAIPQYGIESKARFETIQSIEKEFEGLTIAGNLRNGIGMADRIEQATDIIKKEIEKMN